MIAPIGLEVLAFFATWCTPCKQELPHLAALARSLDGTGVVFVLVSGDGPSSAPNVAALVERHDFPGRLVFDEDSTLTDRYNPNASMPFVVILDDAGAVLWSHAGYEPGDERELAVQIRARSKPVDATPTDPTDGDASLEADPAKRRPRVQWAVGTQTLGLWRRDDYRSLDDPRASGVISRVDASATSGQTRAAVRLDGTYVARTADTTQDLRPEKVSVETRLGPVAARAGDHYASFGHGMILSVRKIDSLGLDTTIRGGRIVADLGPVEVTALGGLLNPQNTDSIAIATFDDPDDAVAGLQLEERVGAARLRQAVVASRLGGAALDGGDVDVGLASVSVDVEGKAVRAAFEAVGLANQGTLAMDQTQWGHGTYAMVSVTRGRATVLGEAKWYRRLAFGRNVPTLSYIEAPTLEREDQQVPGTADAIGGHLRGEWRWTEATTVYASALAYAYTIDGTPAEDGGLATHGYAGADHHLGDRGAIGGTAGYRRETLPDGTEKLHMIQVTADAALAASPRWGLTAKLDQRFETKHASLGPYDFVVSQAVLGVTVDSRVTVSAVYGYSTEAAARPTHYPGAEILVRLGAWGELKAFGGRLVGGRMCVSGACRDVPPFEGAKLDLALHL